MALSRSLPGQINRCRGPSASSGRVSSVADEVGLGALSSWRRRGAGRDPRLRWIPAVAGMRAMGVPMVERRNNDWAWLDAIVGPLDDDFVQAVNEKPGQQERPGLEELFSPPPPKDEKPED